MQQGCRKSKQAAEEKALPGGGLIILTMVLQSVGLPLEGIAIVAGIDRILDMFRTTTNIFGDNSAGVVVATIVGELDREVATTPLDKMEQAGGIHLDKDGRIIDELG